jgi:hypothetical protein
MGQLSVNTIYAQDEIDPDFKVEVHSLDEDMDMTPLDSPYYNKHEGIEDAPEVVDSLPPVKVRDIIFSNVGLNSDVEKMDELDKDMLWRWAKRLPAEELQKKYPNIQSNKLKALKEGMYD